LFESSTIFPGLCPVSLNKSVLKGQQFALAGEVSAKLSKELTEVSENGFQEFFQKLHKQQKKQYTDR
jgi:hypothetical protein